MDDDLIASTHPEWIQSEFDVLTGMFDQVGLWMDVKKEAG